MKRWMLGVLLLPLAAHAGDDYAQQWPLQLSRPDAGAYRVTLDAAVYRAAYWRDLRDVRVLDASGKPVASVLQARPDASAVQAQHVALHWFTLPVTAASQDSDLSVLVQRSTDGAVVSVRSGAVANNDVVTASAWLIDLGKDSTHMHALLLDWGDVAQPLDAGYRLEGSDDLRNWRTLDPQVRLVQLRNQGQELRSNRIASRAARWCGDGRGCAHPSFQRNWGRRPAQWAGADARHALGARSLSHRAGHGLPLARECAS